MELHPCLHNTTGGMCLRREGGGGVFFPRKGLVERRPTSSTVVAIGPVVIANMERGGNDGAEKKRVKGARDTKKGETRML